MRGGALPVLAWAAILAALFAGSWVWTGEAIEYGQLGFAVLLIALCAALLTLANRHAIRRGPPPAAPSGPEQIPDVSFGAVGAALGLGAIALGLAFGHFLIYFGAGLLLLSLARVALELRAARNSVRRHRRAGALEREPCQ